MAKKKILTPGEMLEKLQTIITKMEELHDSVEGFAGTYVDRAWWHSTYFTMQDIKKTVTQDNN